MVKKISFINFKGGVAKTTTAVNFAAILADREKKVLLVDLDPQSNASLWLLGKKRFLDRLNNPDKTIYQLFLDIINSTHNFRFNESVVKAVAKDNRGHSVTPHLDLLPNTYEAIDLEERLALGQANFEILKRQLEDIQDTYDFIIFDCAPNLYLTTINALLFSNYYIIPIFPDYFSRSGLTILVKQIKKILDKYGKFSDDNLQLLGVLLTRIKTNTLDPGRRIDVERALKELTTNGLVSPDATVFKPYFNDTVEVPRSVESFLPTIYYRTSDYRIEQYIKKMNKLVDDVLEKIDGG